MGRGSFPREGWHPIVVSANDVPVAHERISSDVHRTPLLSSRTLSEVAGGPVFLKAENLQRVGAFKFRGALNAVRSLDPAEVGAGVTTYSSGNHGQALALAARICGGRAVVFMPEDAPSTKVAACRGYGAEVVFAGTTSAQRRAACEEAAAERGLTVIPPFDDPRIIAGQGTVGLEIAEQLEDVAEVIVPVGGGGLISGIALYLAERGVRITGVEPKGSDAMRQAIAAGRPVDIDPPTTIADGLKPVLVGDLTHAICAEHVAEVITVDDDAIRDAMHFLLTRAKLVVEPSGAVGVAALLAGRRQLDGKPTVVVLSGGNVAPELLADVAGRSPAPV